MTLQEQLCEKMRVEQSAYCLWLTAQPPEEILHHAYEYSVREDIILATEEMNLAPAQVRALLKSPAPLADVYKDFSKLETDYMSIVAQCVEDRADDLLKKEQQQNPPKVYRQSVTYAREHGELQQYHASCHLNERCRDEIDAALAQRFDGMRLGAGAVEQVVAEYGLERTKYVLAAAIAAADSFDGFITELQNMGYTVKYGPRVEHMAVRHKDAQRNIRIDRLDPRFSETALREYYRQLHRMPTEMQQEYRQENAPAKPKWQPTELKPTVRRARYLGKLPRRYPKVSGFMACYYHYCALLRKAYHGKSTKRCYFLLREDFLLFSRYQQQTKFLWENHIETMDELLAYKENAEVQIQQLARQRKVLYRQKREPERAAREEKIKSLTQQMKALRHEVYICSDIETDAAEVQEKLRQAELAAQEERNEVKQDEQRRRSSRSDGAGSLTGYRSSH